MDNKLNIFIVNECAEPEPAGHEVNGKVDQRKIKKHPKHKGRPQITHQNDWGVAQLIWKQRFINLV